MGFDSPGCRGAVKYLRYSAKAAAIYILRGEEQPGSRPEWARAAMEKLEEAVGLVDRYCPREVRVHPPGGIFIERNRRGG